MTTRLEWAKASPDAYAIMLGLEEALTRANLERPLAELVCLRTSQVNGYVYYVNVHANDVCRAGETGQRLQALCVQQETPYFAPRGHAAPTRTEQLVRLSQDPLPHGLLDGLHEHFDGREVAGLTPAVSAINVWNRFGIGMGMQPE